MIKFLIIVFMVVFLIPSMIFSLWSYFEQKKEAKKHIYTPSLSHYQMKALLKPEVISVDSEESDSQSSAKTESQSAQCCDKKKTNGAPHEVQTIVLKRELYY